MLTPLPLRVRYSTFMPPGTNQTTHLAGAAVGAPAERDLRAALFERVLERIHRYFARVVWDSSAVDDCVQQTLLALERSLQEGTYDPRRSFNRWMWLKAHSVYVNHCRARAREPSSLPEAEPCAEEPEQDHVESRLDAEAVLTHLRKELDPESVGMFVLFYGEGHTITDLAALTGRDRKTVRARLKNAKAAALKLLG